MSAVWQERAARASAAWQHHFFEASAGLYAVRFPNAPSERADDPFHYWWQAHALDALLDAYEREQDGEHLRRAAGLVAGIRRENGGLTNSYYDDMLWLALAELRAHQLSGEMFFLDDVQTLWAEIQGGWNDHCGGGIAWRKIQPDYKNTPANAPAIVLAARLYHLTGDPAALAWARRIMAWLEAHLIDLETGFVWDGLNRLQNGEIDKDWALTYNQGVVIAARLELARVLNDGKYLNGASRTARAAIVRLAPRGLLPDEAQGDGGLFKGIFVRYLAELTLERDAELAGFLATQGEAAWAGRDPQTGLIGPGWGEVAPSPLDLSSALSGVMLLEALGRLEREAPALFQVKVGQS